MADKTKPTGGEAVFDTDQAWDRFQKAASGQPVPAFWLEAEEAGRTDERKNPTHWDGNRDHDKKDGAVEMREKGAWGVSEEKQGVTGETQGVPVVGNKEPVMAGTNVSGRAWRTEKPVRRKLRRLAAGVAAAAMVFGLFTTPLGDRALAFMQQTFRIQHVVGVGISADDMAAISGLLEHGSPEGDRSFNLAQYGTLSQSGGGAASLVTWEEAEQRMGAPLLKLANPSALTYQPEASLTFNLNVKAVNRLLTRLGSTTTLPAEADGKAIQLHIPDGIVTEGTLAGKPARLLQYGKPELTVEGGIDAAAVRDAVLELPVLPESLRTKLASIGDWQSTLPVPARDGLTTSLRIGGHDAVMTIDGNRRILFWLDGDRMSLLGVDRKDFPAEASFRQAAEELIQP
jgi:hypothetical protein